MFRAGVLVDFFVMVRPPPRSTLFPCTTLFRSAAEVERGVAHLLVQAERVLDARLRHALASTEPRSEEHTSELQSRQHFVCRLLLEKTKHPRPRPSPPPLHLTPYPVCFILLYPL